MIDLTGCICGVADLTENGHEFGCPMYISAKQQDNRFYREPAGAPHSGLDGSYRDEFNTTADYDNGLRAAVRLARVLMNKHWPEATGWKPAPDLLGVITQLDHITAHLFGCFAGSVPEPDASMPPAADVGAPCTLADRVGTSAAKTTSDYRRDIAQALEVVRAGARRLHVLGWERSGDDLGRAVEAIESALSFLPLRSSYDRFANDEAAKAIYDTWQDKPGWVAWVDRGNSLMQSEARRLADGR